MEVWKSLNVDKYPLKIQHQTVKDQGVTTRASTKERPIEIGNSNRIKNTSTSDAVRIWNLAPTTVTDCKTLYQVKNAIKVYIKQLPM